jgi:hypothetical protein
LVIFFLTPHPAFFYDIKRPITPPKLIAIQKKLYHFKALIISYKRSHFPL